GARQLVKDADGRLVRIDDPVKAMAAHLGVQLALGEPLAAHAERTIVQTWADCIAGRIMQRPLDSLTEQLMLTDPLPDDLTPQAITFSGGVSEYIFFRETADFGDLGQPLARAIRGALASGAISLPSVVDPNLGIRATAVGASMFSSQTGINVLVTDESVLPLRNVPVLVPRVMLAGSVTESVVAEAIDAAFQRADLVDGQTPVALFFQLPQDRDPAPDAVDLVVAAIQSALSKTIEGRVPFAILSDEDFAHPVAERLRDAVDAGVPLIGFERVSIAEFDFVDLAPVIHPSEVLPFTVKSLLFAGGLDKRSVKQALLDAARS
ncbi:MAG: ethanolamine ammonia-lyase reactivating factor EutA, partial [Chloroflexi bacterium]|nr:ethanolamine ammonia-lyase reactivating factor EutA [Chloroflexota bacterium]